VHGSAGDRIVVPGPHVGSPDRDGEVVTVPHPDGSPPYWVRWSDTGQLGLYFPGPGDTVHHGRTPRAGAQGSAERG
jgi:hypothetical protein